MKSYTFLVHNIYHMGGTTKAISNLANVLSRRGHEVKILSVFKASDRPYFEIDDHIEIVPIIEYNKSVKGLIHLLINRINKFTPFLKPRLITQHEPGLSQFSSFVEKQIIKFIKGANTDVIVGTRASYNLLVSKYGRNDMIKIGMEHMYFNAHDSLFQKEIIDGYHHLDFLTTLTDNDKMDYSKHINSEKVIVVPNILNEVRHEVKKRNVVVAAGRFEYEKGFDLLIESINYIQHEVRKLNFTVELYGDGKEKKLYEELIQKYHLSDIVKLYPTSKQLSKVLAESKITVIPSRVEGFGLVILEAMYQSSVVVSFDNCYGPKFLVNNEDNGFLIEQNDISKYGDKLVEIMKNYESPSIQSLISKGIQRAEAFDQEKIYQIFKSIGR